MPDHTLTTRSIEDAARRLAGFIHLTPVMTSRCLDEMCGNQLFFKCENFQKTGAFKFRGASNALLSLTDDELKKGVATHSSGNHAQALSHAAQILGTNAYIVMPSNSSRVKVEGVIGYGGKITFCEPNLASRESTLQRVIEETSAIEIHPYNDTRIIAGQATAGKELIEAIQDLDYIFAPVGGGGLLSGTALAAHYFSPHTRVIAAEPEQADDAFRSFQSRTFVPSVNPDTIADGLRTSLGSITFPVILQHVHQVVTVSEKSIIAAMKLVWERMKIIIEPSSAVPVAAILENKTGLKGKRIGIIISGGNVDLDRIPWINQ